MSVSDKNRRLKNSIAKRKVDRELSDDGVSKRFLLSCCFLITVALLAGVWIGSQNPVALDQVNRTVNIEEYSFHLVSEKQDDKMAGNWGYTYLHSNNIWLNKELLDEGLFPEQFMSTCHHELLHSYGISSKHHGKIDVFEEQIEDPICIKLKQKVLS